MDDGTTKIVAYWQYCQKCRHKACKDYDDPCNECLSNPVNEYSHKPVKFEEQKTRGKNK